MAYVGIILRDKDKFLLQLRDNKPEIVNPGLWGLFGGSVEGKETWEEGIKREILEELGIILEDIKIKKIYENEEFSLFDYQLSEEDTKKMVLMEGQKIGKFSLNEILNLEKITKGTMEAFLNIKSLEKE